MKRHRGCAYNNQDEHATPYRKVYNNTEMRLMKMVPVFGAKQIII